MPNSRHHARLLIGTTKEAESYLNLYCKDLGIRLANNPDFFAFKTDDRIAKPLLIPTVEPILKQINKTFITTLNHSKYVLFQAQTFHGGAPDSHKLFK